MQDISETEAAYRRYHDVIRRGAPREEFAGVVDMDTYREECVGFTPGWVDAEGALQSFARVTGALRDLQVDFDELNVVGDRVFARLRVSATLPGPGPDPTAPSGRRVTLQGADFVSVRNGRVVERWWIVATAPPRLQPVDTPAPPA